MAKLGGTALFEKKVERTENKPVMGRPRVHGDAVEKVTLTLDKDSIDALDKIGLAIRINRRKVVDRGAIVRAMLKVCLSMNADLNSCDSEAEIEKSLKESIKKEIELKSRQMDLFPPKCQQV
jgi:hypothetical protein